MTSTLPVHHIILSLFSCSISSTQKASYEKTITDYQAELNAYYFNSIKPLKRSENIKTEYPNFTKLHSISNVGRLPQISVPLFGDKIPIGLSFIGAHRTDFNLLTVVKKLKERGLFDFV